MLKNQGYDTTLGAMPSRTRWEGRLNMATNETNMKQAIEDVKQGMGSITGIAKKYGVSKATLSRKVKKQAGSVSFPDETVVHMSATDETDKQSARITALEKSLSDLRNENTSLWASVCFPSPIFSDDLTKQIDALKTDVARLKEEYAGLKASTSTIEDQAEAGLIKSQSSSMIKTLQRLMIPVVLPLIILSSLLGVILAFLAPHQFTHH